MRLGAGIVLIMLVAALPASEARTAESGDKATSVQDGYTADELKNLLQDWLVALKSGDTAKSEAIQKGFAIPDHSLWFAKTFGDQEGPTLEVAYSQLQKADPDWVKISGLHSVQAERFMVQVQAFANPTDTQIALLQAALKAEKQPTPLYYVRTLKSPDDPASSYLGCFVYVDGAFRHLDRRVLEALSTAPRTAKTITLKNVQAAMLIKRVPPVYPEEAIKHRLGGVVRLHVIIAKDGSVQNIRVVEGHAMLIQAAIEAVKQWKYQPTLLDGKPVEVDTVIDVNFQMNP